MKLLRKKFRGVVLAAAILAAGIEAQAAVTLPSILAEHMVVQQNLPVHLWGDAALGERVSVEFRGKHAETTPDALGHWSVYLPPGSAGGPFQLSIRGTNEIIFNDILVGDVWFASGQSNMEFPMGLNHWWHLGVLNMESEISSTNLPNLRLFHVDMQYSALPKTDMSARTWKAASPESVSDFSAVAYFFGKELVEKEGIPIGLIEADVGGTPIEAWTSLKALSTDSTYMPIFTQWADATDKEAKDEMRERLQGSQGQTIPERRSRFFSAPAYLYNAMVAPVTPFPIRGVIWYQGESNTDSVRAPLYARMYPTLIDDWRNRWGEGDFPFLFVQLANFKVAQDFSGWATVREAQLKTLALANTGMAVTIDVGDSSDIHPRNKQEVGHRLALWARAKVYGENNIAFSGPLFRQSTVEGSQVRIWFDYSENGLVVRGDDLRDFEIAGADGKFVPALAVIDGNTVVVSSPLIQSPVYVRYGWSSDPECHLYNKDGLPASPFTSRP